jgi:hypothetical protein
MRSALLAQQDQADPQDHQASLELMALQDPPDLLDPMDFLVSTV